MGGKFFLPETTKARNGRICTFASGFFDGTPGTGTATVMVCEASAPCFYCEKAELEENVMTSHDVFPLRRVKEREQIGRCADYAIGNDNLLYCLVLGKERAFL